MPDKKHKHYAARRRKKTPAIDTALVGTPAKKKSALSKKKALLK